MKNFIEEKKYTDEEWGHLQGILDAIFRHGKKIQIYFRDDWKDENDLDLDDLFRGPLGYRIKPEPETLTLHVWRTNDDGHAWITLDKTAPSDWEYLYSFEHEVWK